MSEVDKENCLSIGGSALGCGLAAWGLLAFSQSNAAASIGAGWIALWFGRFLLVVAAVCFCIFVVWGICLLVDYYDRLNKELQRKEEQERFRRESNAALEWHLQQNAARHYADRQAEESRQQVAHRMQAARLAEEQRARDEIRRMVLALYDAHAEVANKYLPRSLFLLQMRDRWTDNKTPDDFWCLFSQMKSCIESWEKIESEKKPKTKENDIILRANPFDGDTE